MKSKLNLFGSESGSSRWGRASSAGLFFKQQLWIWPLAAAALLFVVGYFLRSAVDRAVKDNLASTLQVVLDADVAALKEWLLTQERIAAAAAHDDDVHAAVKAILAFAEKNPAPLAIAESAEMQALKQALSPWMSLGGYEDFMLADASEMIVASERSELIGKRRIANIDESLKRSLAGETLVSRPYPSVVMLPDADGKLRSGLPTMLVCSPLREGDKTIAALAFRLRPDEGFTDVLQLARLGRTGETYAFDAQGVMLSESRFDDQLKNLGIVPSSKEASSVLSLELRDPGADLTQGARPVDMRSKLPLILPVQAATKGESGVDVEGHRDYRGVQQAGAWTWLDKYGIGIANEVDYREAMAPRRILDIAFWLLLLLLLAMSIAIFVFTVLYARLKQRMKATALKQQRLGQYTLEEKLGEGGMGVVYRGQHALLRRPTAIKLLDLAKSNEAAIVRFEREVQLTSQLNHPNTIAVYDYGRTPEGIFYYAMEYLDGPNLEQLAAQAGRLPEGRVIHLLLQVCGSLAEAHAMGLVHRDIKPANIIVGRRGGVPDFVKLLDFGLVKAIDNQREMTLTAANAVTGTPLYISPESIERPQDVDARCDLYALGAVGYFLLTGSPPILGENLVELCMNVVTKAPTPPSERPGVVVSPAFERVLMRCLSKKASERYASAEELADALREVVPITPWTLADAQQWWSTHETRSLHSTVAMDTSRPNDSKTMIWKDVKSAR